MSSVTDDFSDEDWCSMEDSVFDSDKYKYYCINNMIADQAPFHLTICNGRFFSRGVSKFMAAHRSSQNWIFWASFFECGDSGASEQTIPNTQDSKFRHLEKLQETSVRYLGTAPGSGKWREDRDP